MMPTNKGSLSDEDVERLLDNVRLRTLEVFCEVYDKDGFSSAADSLNLTQPTVSQHIKTLEETLGEKLLLRSKGDIELTPIGRIFYRKVTELKASKEDLKDELCDYFSAGKRELNIKASTIPGEFILPGLLRKFLADRRNVSVDLGIGNSREILEDLDDGQVRWCISGTQSDHSSLEFTPLVVDEMVLVASGELPVEPPVDYDDFRQLSYVGRSVDSGTQIAVQDQFASNGYDPEELLEPSVRLGTIQSVRRAVCSGLGISFLPTIVIREDVKMGRLNVIPTRFDSINRTFFGVKNKFIGIPPIVEEFQMHIKNNNLPKEEAIEY